MVPVISTEMGRVKIDDLVGLDVCLIPFKLLEAGI